MKVKCTLNTHPSNACFTPGRNYTIWTGFTTVPNPAYWTRDDNGNEKCIGTENNLSFTLGAPNNPIFVCEMTGLTYYIAKFELV